MMTTTPWPDRALPADVYDYSHDAAPGATLLAAFMVQGLNGVWKDAS